MLQYLFDHQDYFLHILILICIYLILAQSFNLVFGLGALFNLAHVAVYAIGAYTTALLSTQLDLGFFSCLIASAVVAGFFSLLVGAISLRLKHDYFAIGSLAFSMVVSALLINWKSLTRGVLGIPDIPRPVIGEIDFYQIKNFFYLAAVIAFISQIFFFFLYRSPFARSLMAQSQSESAAKSLGRDVRFVRNMSFFVASCFAGIAGSLFAYYLNYIDPTSFALTEMVFVLTIVVVARPGSFWGIFASVFLLVGFLPEGLRFIEIDSSILGPMRQMLHGIILFVVVYLYRRTLFPVQRQI